MDSSALEKILNRPPQTPLLTTRTAVVLLLGLLCGATAGVLTYLAGDNIAAAILAGLATMGAAIAFFHANLGDDA
jgi:hypothetical protein